MSKLEKLVEQLLRKPTEVSFADVAKILETFGYEEKHSGSGSHRAFLKPGHLPIIVPTVKGRHVKGKYLRMIIEKLGLEEWHDSTFES